MLWLPKPSFLTGITLGSLAAMAFPDNPAKAVTVIVLYGVVWALLSVYHAALAKHKAELAGK